MELMNHTKRNGNILKEKYEHFTHELQEALFENKKALDKLKKVTEEALEESGEKIVHAAKDMQKSIKKNPWAYLGAASVMALLVGFILGKKK